MSKDTSGSAVRFVRSQRLVFLALFLSLALVPLAALGTLTYWQAAQALSSTVDRSMQTSVQGQRDRISAWFQSVQSDVALLAKDDAIVAMDPEAATDVVLTYAEVFPSFENVFLADPTGAIIASKVEAALKINVVDREYFIKAMQGQGNSTDAMVSRQSGDIVVFRAEPVRRGDQVVGAVVVVIPTTEIAKTMQDYWGGETGDAYLVNPAGLLVTVPRFPDVLQTAGLFEQRPELEALIDTQGVQQVLAGEEGVSHYTGYRGEPVIGAYARVEETGWGLIQEVDTAETLASVTQLGTLTLALAGGIVLIVAVLAFWVSRRLSLPVLWIAEGAERLAAGETLDDARIEQIARRQDELGVAGRAFQAMTGYFGEMGTAAAQIAEGDLTVDVRPQSERDRLGNAFAQMVAKLRRQLGTVSDNAEKVETAAGQLAAAAGQAGQATSQISATMQQVANGTSQQAQAVSQTAGSVEQMRRAIDGVANGGQEQAAAVGKASGLTAQITTAVQTMALRAQAGAEGSTRAAQTARAGAQTVGDTIQSMDGIKARVNQSAGKVKEMGTRSDQVGAIVETIDDIASQTNLLALNAAIEAARAGEHGKGFAVVADEVRKLAEKSASATKEIGGLIRGIQVSAGEAVSAMVESVAEVEVGATLAQASGQALEEILTAVEAVREGSEEAVAAARQAQLAANELVGAMDAVSAVVEENTAATEEMAAGSGEVAHAIENIASVSEENSAAVEEVSANAEEMSAQVEDVTASAQSLAEMAQALRQVVNQFRLGQEADSAHATAEAPGAVHTALVKATVNRRHTQDLAAR